MTHLASLTRRWFEEVWNNQNTSVIDELGHPNMTGHGLLDPADSSAGSARFKKFHALTLAAFPDLQVTIEQILTDGDYTTTRYYFTATHTGPGFPGAPEPTNRSVSTTAITIIHWENNKIIEAWNEFDRHNLLQQIKD